MVAKICRCTCQLNQLVGLSLTLIELLAILLIDGHGQALANAQNNLQQQQQQQNNNNNKNKVPSDTYELYQLHPVAYHNLNALKENETKQQHQQQQRFERAQGADGDQDQGDIYNHHHQSAEDQHRDPSIGSSQLQFDESEYNVNQTPNEAGDDKSTTMTDHRIAIGQDETVLSTTSNTRHYTHLPTGTLDQNSNSDNDNNNNNNNNPAETKTLLTHHLIGQTCQLDRGSQRSEQLNSTYLMYCSRYKLENLLSNEILMSIMHHDSRDCERILDEFVQLDATINQFDNLFIKLLSRYNCHNGYSVKWNCDDCKKAYKDWLCSTHLPFYMNGERIKPCISFCERVEQRCPYLHPITREQYGGQPVFICRDPNIPFVPAITPDIPYNEPGKCYDLCHLSDNLTELVIDSLSKYDYDKCPDRGSIAGEVRNEAQSTSGAGDTSGPGPNNKLTPIGTDTGDYPDATYPEGVDENTIVLANRTGSDGQTKVLMGHNERAKTTIHVHNKKLEELREVLANYKNQAKTHRYHADHSSIEHPRPSGDIHS